MKTTVKQIQQAVGTTADGIFGAKTLAAVAARLGVTASLEAVQSRVGAKPDGIFGQETAGKIKSALGLGWPSQAEVRSGKSAFGRAGDESNLVNISTPYPLFYDGTALKTIRVHKLIASAVQNALTDVLAYYGIEQIKKLGLDQYSGCFNYRNSTNGSTLSMHAWGVALDFAAATNTYKMKKPQATLSRQECDMWWRIWEKHGAVSLGRERNYDWMHLQFATL